MAAIQAMDHGRDYFTEQDLLEEFSDPFRDFARGSMAVFDESVRGPGSSRSTSNCGSALPDRGDFAGIEHRKVSTISRKIAAAGNCVSRCGVLRDDNGNCANRCAGQYIAEIARLYAATLVLKSFLKC